MTRFRRRILSFNKQILRNVEDGKPKFLIRCYIYSDGSKKYEIHSVDGEYPDAKFHRRSQLNGWLRQRGYRV